MNKNKIQSLLISHLLKHGQIELLLPNGVTVEIGVTQEDKNGEIIRQEDYCWVIAKHENRWASLDSYNLGISYIEDKENSMLLEEEFIDQNGEKVKRLNVV